MRPAQTLLPGFAVGYTDLLADKMEAWRFEVWELRRMGWDREDAIRIASMAGPPARARKPSDPLYVPELDDETIDLS